MGNALYLGPAGWLYPDWKGTVYPRPAPRGFDPLASLARSVDLVEVNSSFYAPVRSKVAAAWVRRVADFPGFRFVAKAWQRLTHAEGVMPPEDALRRWVDGLTPLVESGRLLAILLQFPHRVRAGDPVLDHVARVRDRLPAVPLAVEFRHRSGAAPEVLGRMRREEFAFVNIDQPAVPGGLPPTAIVTAPLGYVRLHGRNRAAWFAADAGRDARYDYRYARSELEGWARRIAALRQESAVTTVVGNNHYHGKAMAAVLTLAHLLTGEPVVVPDPLLERFPELLPLRKVPPGQLF